MLRFLLPLLAIIALGACTEKQPPRKAKRTTAGAGYMQTVVESKSAALEQVAQIEADRAIKNFQLEEGRFPKDLDELRDSGAKLRELPPGREYVYDPKSGKVLVR